MNFTVDTMQHIMPYLNIYDIYVMCKVNNEIKNTMMICDKKRVELALSFNEKAKIVNREIEKALSSEKIKMPQTECEIKDGKWRGNFKLYTGIIKNKIEIVGVSMSWFSFETSEIVDVILFLHCLLVSKAKNIYINFTLGTSCEIFDDEIITSELNSKIKYQGLYYYNSNYRTFSLNVCI